ncbi:MAG: DEAD/DEAH box helicase family protein, partial [Caldisphaera sp.]
GRILIAIIFNQYKQDIASKNGITLKPVILFKAQKLIQQSKDNKILFHKIINELSKNDIVEIKAKTNIPEIQKALQFYEKEGIDLVQKLKISFAENKCMSVNEDKDKEENQILLNHLEDENNQIRAIFAVQKLNEGWDVLNLFDIVRLYEGRDSKNNKVGKTTISEVQLIGRGARYFPFNSKNNQNSEDKYKRKFDKDLNNELRILEELYFHAFNEPKYIYELDQALEKEGLRDPKTVKKELKLKDSFKETDFYKSGLIYLNSQEKNDYSKVISIKDLGADKKSFIYQIHSFKGKIIQAFSKDTDFIIQKTTKTFRLSQIEQHIIKNAIAKDEFFSFKNIKKYFPKTKSIKDFIEENFEDIDITFSGTKEVIDNLSNKEIYAGVSTVMNDIKAKIKSNLVDYKGSKIFNPNYISAIFTDKIINVEKGKERAEGDESFLRDKEWYAFNANYGTSEEKGFVEFFNRFLEQLKADYREVYLLRNELFFRIYNFDDGRPFSPDFVLFLKTKNGNELTYQIFIEPKGEFIEKYDEWKELFLKEIKGKFKISGIKNFMETSHYMIIGIPFFRKDKETVFKEELINELS